MKTIFRVERESLIIEAIRNGCDNSSAIRAATGIPRGTLHGVMRVLYAKYGAAGFFEFCEQVRQGKIKPQEKRPARAPRRDFIIMDTSMTPANAAFFMAQWNAEWVGEFCEALGRELERNRRLEI